MYLRRGGGDWGRGQGHTVRTPAHRADITRCSCQLQLDMRLEMRLENLGVPPPSSSTYPRPRTSATGRRGHQRPVCATVSSGFKREAIPIKNHDAQSFIHWIHVLILGASRTSANLGVYPCLKYSSSPLVYLGRGRGVVIVTRSGRRYTAVRRDQRSRSGWLRALRTPAHPLPEESLLVAALVPVRDVAAGSSATGVRHDPREPRCTYV